MAFEGCFCFYYPRGFNWFQDIFPLPSQPAALLASCSSRPSCGSSLCTFGGYWFWSNVFGCCFRFWQLLLPKGMVDPQTLSANKARNKLGNRLWVPTVAGCWMPRKILLFFFFLRDLFCFGLPVCLMTWWCLVVAVAIASLHQSEGVPSAIR